MFNLIRFHAYGRFQEPGGVRPADGSFRVERIPTELSDEFRRRNFPFPIDQLANRGESYRVNKAADTQE